MKRRAFLTLPFVAAIAGVAKRCFGRETPKPAHSANGLDDVKNASAFYRDNRDAMDAAVHVVPSIIGIGEHLEDQGSMSFPGWQTCIVGAFDVKNGAAVDFVKFCNKHIPVELSMGGKRRIHLLIVEHIPRIKIDLDCKPPIVTVTRP